MRKWLSLSVIFFILAGFYSSAVAKPISIGAFAGLNVPIGQEDAGNGPLFGAKLRVAVGSIFALEPTLTFLQQGDATAEIGNEKFELDGGKSTALGLNLILGSPGPPSGVSFYGVLGLASHAMKQEGAEDQNRLALSFGPGAEIGVGDKLALDIQARLHMISLDGGGARKNLGFSGGLVYYLSNWGH